MPVNYSKSKTPAYIPPARQPASAPKGPTGKVPGGQKQKK
jgi:hypothetical protein